MGAQTQRRTHFTKAKQKLAEVLDQIWTLKCVLRHPGVPWYAKVVAGASAMYLVSPVQLIPNFIPVIGQMDDLFVLFVGMKLLRRLTPAKVLAECERRDDRPAILQRLLREQEDGLEFHNNTPVQ